MMNRAPFIRRIAQLLLFGLIGSIHSAAAAEFLPLPGAPQMPADVQQAIDQAWEERNPEQEVRTQHRHADGAPHYANRLILELSPYLNQHAHNPVNWFSWGEEAFAHARQTNRPMLVSIGYSSCHWCHVMEEESYDNLRIAALLNECYVAVKVDREINPDVDELYMLAVQMMGELGGWPLHVFITPEGKPFHGMVYVPPQDFEVILTEIHRVWESDRVGIESFASQVTHNIQTFGASSSAEIELGRAQVDLFVAELSQEAQLMDEYAPPRSQFPAEAELFLLLDTALRHDDDTALKLAEDRLTDMAMGGIRDHVGGGFHRYAVDNEWLVPHFEKMLYNQALLARAYLQGYELTGRDLYRRVAEQTLEYVLRDMQSDEGVFWSATDADSEGKEGTFFVWTKEEIIDTFGADADFIIDHYGITEAGNFEYGENILHLTSLPEARAVEAGMSVEAYLQKLTATAARMREVRDQREKPYLDDKVITAWNALMITALAKAGSVLSNDRYLDEARTAAEHLWANVWDERESHLYRIMRDGQLSESGKLRDYANLAESMLTLYDETDDAEWLERARVLADSMVERFWDSERGGFYSVSEDDAQTLIARQKDRFDDALPSGNAVAARALSMLFHRTGQFVHDRLAEQLFQTFAAEILQIPRSYGYTLKALEEHRAGSIGPHEYTAAGNSRVSIQTMEHAEGRLHAVVEIDLADGWHIQSDRPLAENLIATHISNAAPGWQIEQVSYPPADEVSLSFQDQPLSVFSGVVQIPVELSAVGESYSAVKLNLQLQACNDEVCLLQETIQLELPAGRFTG